MEQTYIYNLDELIQCNHFHHQYGSALACFPVDGHLLQTYIQPGTLPSFITIILVTRGVEHYLFNNQEIELKANDLLVKLPYDSFSFKSCSKDASSLHLLVEKNYSDDLVFQNKQLPEVDYLDIFSTFPIFHLSGDKAEEFRNVLSHICHTIERPHLYKQELLTHQLFFCQLLLAELVSGIEINANDLKHKDNILKFFLHLASRHFRKERQVQFYADQLNISSTYLSRTIKELTGNTVYSFLSHFLYSEICIQLQTTEKPINEIADELHFNDQSALTNFFRSRAGVSPLAYRKGKRPA